MRFDHVCVDTVVHVDAPVRLSSADIMQRLRPAVDRLGMRTDLLEEVAGIRERRVWSGPMPVADAATLAGQRALAHSGVPPANIGVLINTSVLLTSHANT